MFGIINDLSVEEYVDNCMGHRISDSSKLSICNIFKNPKSEIEIYNELDNLSTIIKKEFKEDEQYIAEEGIENLKFSPLMGLATDRKIATIPDTTMVNSKEDPDSTFTLDNMTPKNLIYIIDEILGEVFPKETLDKLLEIVHNPGETFSELQEKLDKLDVNFEKILSESPLVAKWGKLFPKEFKTIMANITEKEEPTPTTIDFDSRRDDDGICVVTDIIEVEKLVGGARGDIIKVTQSNRGLGVDDPKLLPAYLIVTDKMPEGDAILADPGFKLTKKSALVALKKKGM